jgi:hypothetical protein
MCPDKEAARRVQRQHIQVVVAAMPEACVAATTEHLREFHLAGCVRFGFEIAFNWLPETPPARAGIELNFRGE